MSSTSEKPENHEAIKKIQDCAILRSPCKSIKWLHGRYQMGLLGLLLDLEGGVADAPVKLKLI